MIKKLSVWMIFSHGSLVLAAGGYLAHEQATTPSRRVADATAATPNLGTPAQLVPLKAAEYFGMAENPLEFGSLEYLINKWANPKDGFSPFHVYGNFQQNGTGSTLIHAVLKAYKAHGTDANACLSLLKVMVGQPGLRKDLKDNEGKTVLDLVENDARLAPFEQALKAGGFESTPVVEKVRRAQENAVLLQEIARAKTEKVSRLRAEIAAEEAAANKVRERAVKLQEEARQKEQAAIRLEKEVERMRDEAAREAEAEQRLLDVPQLQVPDSQSPALIVPPTLQSQDIGLPKAPEPVSKADQCEVLKREVQEVVAPKSSPESSSVQKTEGGLPLGKISMVIGGGLALFFGKRIYEERERQERLDREKREIKQAE